MILKEIKKIKVVVLVLSSKRAKEVRYIGLLFFAKKYPPFGTGDYEAIYDCGYIISHKLSVYQTLTCIDPVNVADVIATSQ